MTAMSNKGDAVIDGKSGEKSDVNKKVDCFLIKVYWNDLKLSTYASQELPGCDMAV